MKKFKISVIIIFLSIFSHAQEYPTIENNNHKIIAKVSLSSFAFPDVFNLYYGILSAGVEKSISNNTSVSLQAGYILNYGKSEGLYRISANSVHGFNTNLEYRKYFGKYSKSGIIPLLVFPFWFQGKTQQNGMSGLYYAVHLHGQNLNISRSNNDIYTYLVNRKSVATHVKLGYQSINKSNIVLDQGIGIGIRYISSNSKNKLGNSNDFEFPYSKPLDNGDKLFFSWTYHLNIGFAFK